MTPPNVLKAAHPTDFVGEYTARVDGSDTAVPVVEVYKGRAPDGSTPEGTQIYEFLPVPGAENGDIADGPLAAIAVEGIHKAGSRTEAHLTLVVSGGHLAEAVDRNPVTEGSARFGRLLEILTQEEGVDRVYMTPDSDTNVPKSSLRRLGFEETEGSEDVHLDLPVDKRAA